MTSNVLFGTVAASNFIIMEVHLIAEFAKEWECINNGMEYRNGGMEFFKFNIIFYIHISTTPPL